MQSKGIKKIEVYGYATPVSDVTLSQTSAALTVGGDGLTLTPTVAPANATDKTVTWTTSDASVATVADGVVTAVAAGTATITATATNGTDDTADDKTATCTVTVTQNYKVTLADGTDDAGNWTISPATAEEDQTVTITYNGTKKVKSIKAVKKASAVTTLDNTTSAWASSRQTPTIISSWTAPLPQEPTIWCLRTAISAYSTTRRSRS